MKYKCRQTQLEREFTTKKATLQVFPAAADPRARQRLGEGRRLAYMRLKAMNGCNIYVINFIYM